MDKVKRKHSLPIHVHVHDTSSSPRVFSLTVNLQDNDIKAYNFALNGPVGNDFVTQKLIYLPGAVSRMKIQKPLPFTAMSDILYKHDAE